MEKTIKIEIHDLRADDEYFSFSYTITVDGKKRRKESYDSDYDGHTPSEMMGVLKEVYGVFREPVRI